MPTILVHPGSFDSQGELDNVSLRRLERGFKLYKEFLKKGVLRQDIFFISTIKDKGRGGLSQSELIKEWLISKGVSTENIVIASQSINTWQDIDLSCKLICDLGLPKIVYHISNINHVWPRIWMTATFHGAAYKVQGKYVAERWMSPLDSMGEIIAISKTIISILKSFWKKRS